MFATSLTDRERDDLIESVAQWAVRLEIGTIIAFLLEINQPIAPITGNLCIAFGPMVSTLLPIPFHSFGLLLQEDASVKRLRKTIERLMRERRCHTTTGRAACHGLR